MVKPAIATLILECSLSGKINKVLFSDTETSLTAGESIFSCFSPSSEKAAKEFLQNICEHSIAENFVSPIVTPASTKNFRFSGSRSGNVIVLRGVSETATTPHLSAQKLHGQCTTENCDNSTSGASEETIVIARQNQMEQALRDRERQVIEISSSIPGFVYQFHRSAAGKYHFSYATGRVKELIGLPAKDIYEDVNKAWEKVHPADLPVLLASIEKSAAELTPFQLVYRVIPEAGSIKYLHGVAQPTLNCDNSITWNGAIIDVTESATAGQKVVESEKQYRILLETIREGVLQVDENVQIVFANKQMCDLTGYTLAELLGQNPSLIFKVYDSDLAFLQHNQTLRQKGIGSSYELCICRKQGERIWVSVNAVPIIDKNGNLVGTIATHQDITQEKKAKAELLQSEKRYRTLFRENPLPMWVYAKDTKRILAVNQAAVNHYKYSEEEFLAMTPLDFRPAEDKKEFGGCIAKLQEGSSFNKFSRHYKKSGELIDVYITASRFNYEGTEAILVISQDVSVQTKTELDRNRLTSIIEATSDLIGIFDTEGKCTFMNPAGNQLLGLDAAPPAEQNTGVCPAILAQDFLGKDLLKKCRQNGSWSGETQLLNGDGILVPVSLVVLAHKDTKGEVQYYSIIARDISELKKSAYALQQSKARYKSLFEQNPNPIFSIDNQGNITSANTAFRKIMGKELADTPHVSFLQIIDSEMRTEAHTYYEQVLKGTPIMYNTVIADKNKTRMIVNINQIPIVVNDGIVGAFGMVQDETNMFHMTQELQQSHRELRELTSRIQVAQEEERKYIAREIHDELGQVLTALNIDITLLLNKVVAMLGTDQAKELTDDMEDLKYIAKEAILSVKRIVSELRPIAIDEIGLLAELRLYMERFQTRYSIQTNIDVPDEQLSLTAEQAIEVYRIVQEALTNVARHSKATKVTLEITQQTDRITLVVYDNGIGIQHKSDATVVKSFGLIGMRERALMMGGTLLIASAPDAGTTVKLEIPVMHETEKTNKKELQETL